MSMADILYRYNVMSVDCIDAFLNVKGGFFNNVRDVYFVKMIGENQNLAALIDETDRRMACEMRENRLKYIRINELPKLIDKADADKYSQLYTMWKNKETVRLSATNDALNTAIGKAAAKAAECYREGKSCITDSMEKNLVVKIFFWFDKAVGAIFSDWNEKRCIKVLADNVEKDQELLFYLFLTFLGSDVLLIENRTDIKIGDGLKRYICEFKIGDFGKTYLSKYIPQKADDNQPHEYAATGTPTVHKSQNKTVYANNEKTKREHKHSPEMNFEELALMASSVVMIAVHNDNGDIMATGSGIMLGKNGYILTNNHVVAGGSCYSLRIEDDDRVYRTNEIVKYNYETDLAIIRIERQLTPIPIYSGKEKPVRGQRVVAIGSPLGLFNSVSDGIISGFRNINGVDMIQFTAPISHGSSGGAVLNMHGEVIGISTAGMDDGQNLNLAVGYDSILMFAKGFLT